MDETTKAPAPPALKPLQTQGTVRDYAPDGHGGNYGPAHTASFGIAPSGPRGAHCREYWLNKDERMAPAFVIDDSNDHSWWEMANETNGNRTALTVRLCKDNQRRNVVATFEGRATGTGQPFGHFSKVPHGLYFLDIEVSPEQYPNAPPVPNFVHVPLWLQASP